MQKTTDSSEMYIYTVKGQIKVKAEHYDKVVSIYDTDDIRQLKLK